MVGGAVVGAGGRGTRLARHRRRRHCHPRHGRDRGRYRLPRFRFMDGSRHRHRADLPVGARLRRDRGVRVLASRKFTRRPRLDGDARGRTRRGGDGHQRGHCQTRRLCDRCCVGGIGRRPVCDQDRHDLPGVVQARAVDHHPRDRDRRRHGEPARCRPRCRRPHRGARRTNPAGHVARVRRLQAPHLRRVAHRDDAEAS